jgi:hypothetical protein
MKELLKHLPAIKDFIEERTQAIQQISDQVLRNFLKEAYKLPFLFPVRIIVSEDKFVNFLFDMRKELLERKKMDITDTSEPQKEENKEEIKKEETQKETAVKETEEPATKKTVAKANPQVKATTKAKTTTQTTSEKKSTSKTVKSPKTTTKKEKLVP